MIDPKRLAEVEEKERQHVAYHEAGHAVVIAAFGERLDLARVWKNENGNLDDKAWRGQVVQKPGMEAQVGIVVGLAGLAAEFIYSEGYAVDADIQEVAGIFNQDYWSYWEPMEEISATDAALIGPEPPLWAFRKVVTVLLRNWQAVVAVQQMLLQDGEVEAARIEPLVNEELPPWMDDDCT